MGNKLAMKRSTELRDIEIVTFKIFTNLTEKEIREWHARFIRENPTGRLDRKKFGELYKQFYPQGNVDNFCKRVFDTFDRNNNGTIDFGEFLMAILVVYQGDLDKRLSVTFDLYDYSKDGLIDEWELADLLSAMYVLFGETDLTGDRDPKKRAAQIIAKLDINGDKKLSKEEFIIGCKSDPVIRQLLVPNLK